MAALFFFLKGRLFQQVLHEYFRNWGEKVDNIVDKIMERHCEVKWIGHGIGTPNKKAYFKPMLP